MVQRGEPAGAALDIRPTSHEALLAELNTKATADYIKERALVLSRKYQLSEADAEALANAVHANLVQYIEKGKFDLSKRWQPLVETSIKNRLIDLQRSKMRHGGNHYDVDDSAHQTASSDSSPEENVARDEALAKMREAVPKLPNDLQPIILMTLEGKTTREIADELQIEIRKVRDRLTKGQQMLRELLVEQDDLEEAA